MPYGDHLQRRYFVSRSSGLVRILARHRNQALHWQRTAPTMAKFRHSLEVLWQQGGSS